jgi:hypothetical protein
MKAGGCLLKILVFLVVFPLVLVMPPVALAIFMFLAFTLHFYRKG